MNDGYLLADCVFGFFSNSGFIHYSEWKHETRERYYTVSFSLQGTRSSIVSFEIIVSGGLHKITKSIVRILEKRFSLNFDTVFSDCVIQ
jgi:hypothetical protein